MYPQVLIKGDITYEIMTMDNKEIIAARCKPLGLTAYGDNDSEALDSLEKLVKTFIVAHRENGSIEQVLNSADVEWEYVDDCFVG